MSINLSIYLVSFFLRAMKTSIDSLKLAVSWKGSQIPGAKFSVKVGVHWCASLGRGIIFCVIFVFYITSVPKSNLSFAKGLDNVLFKCLLISLIPISSAAYSWKDVALTATH